MNMAVSAIQHMVVLKEPGSELKGYYYFFLRVRSIQFSFFFVLVVFNLLFLISACHQEVSSKIQGTWCVYALQFDWQRNYIVVKFELQETNNPCGSLGQIQAERMQRSRVRDVLRDENVIIKSNVWKLLTVDKWCCIRACRRRQDRAAYVRWWINDAAHMKLWIDRAAYMRWWIDHDAYIKWWIDRAAYTK